MSFVDEGFGWADTKGATSIDKKHPSAEIAVEGMKKGEEVKAPCRISVQGRGLRRGSQPTHKGPTVAILRQIGEESVIRAER